MTKLPPESFTGCATELLLDVPLELAAEENSGNAVPDVVAEAGGEKCIVAGDGADSSADTVKMVDNRMCQENSGLAGVLLNLADTLRGK